jgi:hypothetical protein
MPTLRILLTIVICLALHITTLTRIASAQPGPVAAYSFNEGTGTTVGDASGNGHDGVISGATWSTTGRFAR